MQQVAVDLDQSGEPRVLTSTPVRVLIDARKLGHGGIGSYIENLVTGLLQCGGVQLSLLARPDACKGYSFSGDVAWIEDTTPLYSIRELIGLRRRVRWSDFDIFHAPHYTLPFGIPIPTVVTVHDIIHVTHPEKFYYPCIGGALIKSAVRRADRVVTVSADTQAQVVALTGAPASKVKTISNAVVSSLIDAAALRTGVATGGGEDVNDAPPYILAVFSTMKPHKGLPDLVNAYRVVRELYGANKTCPDLLLVGYGTEEIAGSRHLAELVAATTGVRVLGRVSIAEMAGLYRRAHCVVVPSLAEGFCLPALEAQAFGTPVVCRPVPALKEIVTANDCVVADFSVPALGAGLYAASRRSMVPRVANTEVIERFAPRVVAQKMLDLYRNLLPCCEVRLPASSVESLVGGGRS